MDVPIVIRKNPFRQEIDEKLIAGESYSAIERWLDEKGAKVGRNTLAKYHKFCFNVNEEAIEVYNERKSKEKLNEEAEKGADVLEFYDKVIAKALEGDLNKIDPARRTDLGLRAAKQREEFMKDHGDMLEEERIQVLKDIRDMLISGEVKELVNSLKFRQTFEEDPLCFE